MYEWTHAPLSRCVESLDAGVSVNAEDRPHRAGEIGVLKTSALSGYVFHPEQNKAVVRTERRLVAQPVLANSILVSRMNTPALVGESCYVAEEHKTLFLPDRIWQVKLRAEVPTSIRWLSYVLQSNEYRHYVEVHATGTSGSMKNLAKSALLSLPVSYPEESEQTQIAAVLSTLDSAIFHTEAIVEKLNNVRQGLLHDLLTRGVDANGELRPSYEEAPHLYQSSLLGWVPKEWEIVTLKQIAARSSGILQTGPFGSQLHAHEYVADGVPVVMPQDIVDGRLSVHQIARITHRKAVALSRHRLVQNDIVFSRRGDLSRCVAIEDEHAGWLCGTGCLLARLSRKEINGFWLALVYQQPGVQSQVLGRAVGSTMANLNTSILGELTIARPTVDEQNEITLRLKAATHRMNQELADLAKLRQQKIGLMDDLLTARVRVTPLLVQ